MVSKIAIILTQPALIVNKYYFKKMQPHLHRFDLILN